MEKDCPTCQLIATGGMFFDAECKDHPREPIVPSKPEDGNLIRGIFFGLLLSLPVWGGGAFLLLF